MTVPMGAICGGGVMLLHLIVRSAEEQQKRELEQKERERVADQKALANWKAECDPHCEDWRWR